MRALGKNKKLSTNRTMFFDGDVEIARYDVLKYPQLLLETRRGRHPERCK